MDRPEYERIGVVMRREPWHGDQGADGGVGPLVDPLGGVLQQWTVAAEHLEMAMPSGIAGATLDGRRTQLAYVCLLLGRGTAADVATAERLLGGLIATDAGCGAPVARAAPPPSTVRAPLAYGPAPVARATSRYEFRCEGDYWTLAGEGTLSRLRGLRGLGYIAELLRHPHEPIYVVDLIALGASEQRLDRDQIAEHGLRVSAEADVGPMLDRRARDDYRARWRELLVEQAEAQRDNDPGRAERVQRELDMLGAQLSAVGAGTGRNGPSLKERARVNVRNCISAALRAIRARHNPLWRHLSNSIKTGAFCCYAPDRPVEWDM